MLRPRSLVALTQAADHVEAQFDDGSRCRAHFLVGADGMHSRVREASGIAFTGGKPGSTSTLNSRSLSSARARIRSATPIRTGPTSTGTGSSSPRLSCSLARSSRSPISASCSSARRSDFSIISRCFSAGT
ncbi:MAG TPA: FAD-dependent monooxygenase [Anaerolineae bacterium]|nr:FAD-dependent monooxygenase [Anaerolineae bacterium]